jgi:type IV secretory pathway VirD2 relaxase
MNMEKKMYYCRIWVRFPKERHGKSYAKAVILAESKEEATERYLERNGERIELYKSRAKEFTLHVSEEGDFFVLS